MAEEPSKTPGTSAERPSSQIIPLSKIHDLPGVFTGPGNGSVNTPAL